MCVIRKEGRCGGRSCRVCAEAHLKPVICESGAIEEEVCLPIMARECGVFRNSR